MAMLRKTNQLREVLAGLARQQWSGWMAYLFEKSHKNENGEVVIPVSLVARWERQIATPYSELSLDEQDSDRREADKFLAVIGNPTDGDDVTVTIQIGNSDDKLTQREWATYVAEIEKMISEFLSSGQCEVHFYGGSYPAAPWQNMTWVVVCKSSILPALRVNITRIRSKYRQDSVAFTTGTTEFI